jgi:hypothetical protein
MLSLVALQLVAYFTYAARPAAAQAAYYDPRLIGGY